MKPTVRTWGVAMHTCFEPQLFVWQHAVWLEHVQPEILSRVGFYPSSACLRFYHFYYIIHVGACAQDFTLEASQLSFNHSAASYKYRCNTGNLLWFFFIPFSFSFFQSQWLQCYKKLEFWVKAHPQCTILSFNCSCSQKTSDPNMGDEDEDREVTQGRIM